MEVKSKQKKLEDLQLQTHTLVLYTYEYKHNYLVSQRMLGRVWSLEPPYWRTNIYTTTNSTKIKIIG